MIDLSTVLPLIDWLNSSAISTQILYWIAPPVGFVIGYSILTSEDGRGSYLLRTTLGLGIVAAGLVLSMVLVNWMGEREFACYLDNSCWYIPASNTFVLVRPIWFMAWILGAAVAGKRWLADGIGSALILALASDSYGALIVGQDANLLVLAGVVVGMVLVASRLVWKNPSKV